VIGSHTARPSCRTRVVLAGVAAVVLSACGSSRSATPATLPATRADLLRRLDRPAEAAAAYRKALELTATDAERRYLKRRLAETSG